MKSAPAAPETTHTPLEDRFDVLAILGLVFVSAIRWWRIVLTPTPLVDESVYLQAFEAVSAGESPFSVKGYFYVPLFAEVGAQLLRALGDRGVLYSLRSINLLGLSMAVWLSLAMWPTTRFRRFVIAALYVSLAPAIWLSLVFGNISFAAIGLVLLALTLWPARPWIAGALLGLSITIKPLAPVGVLALGVHRPADKGRAQWIAAGLASLIMGAVLFPPSRLLEMTSQAIKGHSYDRTLSAHRILSLMGIEVSPLEAAIVVAVITVLVCLCLTMTAKEVLCVATTASVLATPAIWAHTLLLVLPVQVIALERAWARRSTELPTRRHELWFVVLAIAALQFSSGAGLVDLMAPPIQIVALGVPYLAAPGLTAFILVTRRQGFDLAATTGSRRR